MLDVRCVDGDRVSGLAILFAHRPEPRSVERRARLAAQHRRRLPGWTGKRPILQARRQDSPDVNCTTSDLGAAEVTDHSVDQYREADVERDRR